MTIFENKTQPAFAISTFILVRSCDLALSLRKSSLRQWGVPKGTKIILECVGLERMETRVGK